MARDLIDKAISENKEVDVEKLVFSVVNEHAVPEAPLRKGINMYIDMQEGLLIQDGIIKKEA